MAATPIDIAVACGYVQHKDWWAQVWPNIIAEVQAGWIYIERSVASGTAVVDGTKNREIGYWVNAKRASLTDANRCAALGINADGAFTKEGLMSSPAEWIFWMDDDTVPPPGTIKRLLDLRREFVAGMYFSGNPPKALAYVRRENGFYSPIANYALGTLTTVDAVGMGCTLIHKDVYRKIMDAHEVYVRPNASLMAVPKSAITADPYAPQYESSHVVNGTLVMPLTKPEEDDNRPWPFYSMEAGRTEDLHFCELARNAGVQIYVDTSINCKHIKTRDIRYEDYREFAEANYE